MAQKKEQVFLSVVVQGTDKIVGMKQQMVELKKAISDTKTQLKKKGANLKDLSRQLAQQEVNLKKTTKLYREEQRAILSSNKAKKAASSFTMKMATAFGAANIATSLFMGSMRALKKAIKDGIVTFKDFEFQMAKVKAISGANDKEFKKLKDSAQELGRTTFFTASQVGELQLNLSKLGFRPEEILQSQEAILMLSTAMGEDLGRTATVVAASLRGFGESTEETGRFADAMAAAFSNSALDIEKFQTSMSKVSAIAAMAGFSFEETTGLLALLTNSGMEASIAGTSLRNILLHLQDPTSDLSQRLGRTVHSGEDLIVALKELSDSGIDVAGVMEIVDRRQVQAMNSFIAGADTLTEFNKILNASSGSAEDMADIMENTLGGALLKLKSAYEGLTLAFVNGSGVMQSAVEFLATTLNSLADSFTSADTKAEKFVTTTIKDLKKEFKELSESEEDFDGTLSGMMAHRRGRMEQRLQDTKKDLELFFEQNSKFAIARDNDLIAQQKALEKEIKIKELAVKKMGAAISAQTDKEKEAADKFEENEKRRLALLAAEAEANSSLIKIQEDKLEQAKKLPETTEAEITSKNILIKSIETEIKRLKELGIEQQKIDFSIPEANIGEGFAALVKDRMAELDAEIKEQEAQLMQDYVDGRITSEAELNEAIFNMKIATFDAERNLVGQMSIAHDAAGKAMIELEGKKKLATERTTEANKKQGEQLIENAIMGAQSVEEAFASVLTVKINEILLNALASMFEDKTIPFFAKLALGLGMKSIVTPMINNLVGIGGGGSSQVETQGTFAKGGLTNGGMFEGASHANGGIKFAVGGRIMEAEGGEAIINKRSTARFRPILSAINSYNGNGVKFADGGLINSGEKFAMGGELRSIQQMVSGGGSSKVVMVESDVTKTQGRVSSLEAQASF